MTKRRTYPKGDIKRDEILDAAMQAFVDKGYDRVSLREVARMVDLSQAGLLHHFANKEHLFLEVLRRRDELVALSTGNDHRHSIDGLVQAVERNAQQAGLVALYVVMSAESVHTVGPAQEFFAERYKWLVKEIAADVKIKQDEGEISVALAPRAVAETLVAAADGLQIQWLLNPSGVDMAARMRELVRQLAPSIGAA